MLSLRERLKVLTKPFHDEVETGSLSAKIMDEQITKDEYVSMLTFLYEALKPLEDAIFANKDNFSIDVQKRFRASLLQNDLAKLGCKTPETTLFGEKDFEWLVGSMYVFEGSTMGGIWLFKALSSIDFAKDARSYFLPYGESTMPMWKEFTLFLDEVATRDDFDDNKAILAACETFLRLKQKITI